MAYRVYSGPRGAESLSPFDKAQALYKEFARLDEALQWARRLNEGQHVALLIEGDDGTRMTKQEVAAQLAAVGSL